MSCSNLYLLYNKGNTRDVAKASGHNKLDLSCSNVNNLEILELDPGQTLPHMPYSNARHTNVCVSEKTTQDKYSIRIATKRSVPLTKILISIRPIWPPTFGLIFFEVTTSASVRYSAFSTLLAWPVNHKNVTCNCSMKLVIGMNVVISNTQQKPAFSCVTTKRSGKDRDLTSMSLSFITSNL
uniref:Uncharacterized protein n=1 Tax=Glossina pallidipes TaxID=7398 RepID=A0A1B0AEE7_GLOPL